MNKEEIGIIKLGLLHKLMTMYMVGTGKPADYKNEKGEYEIISFVKATQTILKGMGTPITLEHDQEFVENFFALLFKQKEKLNEI